MKIVQSFWSLPFRTFDAVDPNNRWKGGWLSERIFLMSTALSCLRLKKYYDHVELVTDDFGKKMLIDDLDLPFSKVVLGLDSINSYPTELWTLAKLYVYGLQSEPFLHVDSDIFIWREFDQATMTAPLIAQNEEKKFEVNYYEISCREIAEHFTFIPESAAEYVRNGGVVSGIRGYNGGLMGGTDFQLFNRLYSVAYEIVERNRHHFHKMNLGLLNLFIEQGMFNCLAAEKKIRVHTLFDNVSEDFNEMTDIIGVPDTWYIHALGKSKKSQVMAEQIYLRLKMEFPQYFEVINSYCESKLTEHAL